MSGALNEQKIIRLIGEYLPASDPRLIVGPGDDAAVLQGSTLSSVLTSDLLVEGVHFDLRLGSLADSAWKALAVNISDVAAMGGDARFALGSLGVPPQATEAQLRELLGGLADCAREFGICLIGGDTVRAPQWIIGFTLLGALSGPPFTRTLARPGDLILHSGSLGLAQLGLHALCGELPGFALSRRAQLRPRPRTDVAMLLRQRELLPACIDLSDSLSKSLLLLAAASGVGLRVDLQGCQFHPELRQFAASMPQLGEGGFLLPAALDPAGQPGEFSGLADFLLSAAEDYELLLCAPEAALEVLPQLSVLGHVVEAHEGCGYTDEAGRQQEIRQSGFEHFNS